MLLLYHWFRWLKVILTYRPDALNVPKSLFLILIEYGLVQSLEDNWDWAQSLYNHFIQGFSPKKCVLGWLYIPCSGWNCPVQDYVKINVQVGTVVWKRVLKGLPWLSFKRLPFSHCSLNVNVFTSHQRGIYLTSQVNVNYSSAVTVHWFYKSLWTVSFVLVFRKWTVCFWVTTPPRLTLRGLQEASM